MGDIYRWIKRGGRNIGDAGEVARDVLKGWRNGGERGDSVLQNGNGFGGHTARKWIDGLDGPNTG